jgi:hypothetical protein
MLYVRQLKLATFTAAAVLSMAMSPNLAAQDTATNVLYHAIGTFANQPISGNDLLLLSGEPFNFSVTASEAATPSKKGTGWAIFTNLTMEGVVHSGFNPEKPFKISSSHSQIYLSKTNASYDEFKLTCPVVVVGIHLTVVADVHLPKGTLIVAGSIKPFKNKVTLTASDITVTYSRANPPAATILGVAQGTMSATVQQ